MLPSLFLSHGSPTVMVEKDSAGRVFLSKLGGQFEKPTAIVVVSAHWETERPQVTASLHPEIIYDFYGFDQELYQITYPAPGAPDLAQKVCELVGAELEFERGFDHGVWAPLYLMYPKADIPVVQLSLQSAQPPEYHYKIGQKLARLRKEGVLIIGSGSTTHNLKKLKWFEQTPDDFAQEFEDWFTNSIETQAHDALINAPTTAPHFEVNHPSIEHWLPLYVAMGAGKSGTVLHRGFEHRNLSMASLRFD